MLSELELLRAEREEELDDLQDQQAEAKFKQTADVKKRFNLKIALALKGKKEQEVE